VRPNAARSDKTVRCIALLIALARAKRGIQLRPFFERRGWSWRGAYRDVETLRRAGVPIEHRERGWFRVAEDWIPAGAIGVTRDELAALIAARRLAPVLGELDALWSKLTGPNQLPLPLDVWLDVRPPSLDYGPHRLTVATAQRAIREHRVLRLHYRSAAGEETSRLVEPATVRWEPSTEALYIVAWCRTRMAERVFAVHRILDAQTTTEEFTLRPDAIASLGKAFRLWLRPGVEQVSLRFSRHVANEVRERRWHPSQTFTALADGDVRLEMEIAAPQELERLLLGYGPDVVVEAPGSLADRIRELHAACLGGRLGMRRGPVRAPAPRRRVDTQ
jgi:predicted DNA-binding transcriptional regulator YafY